MLDQVPDLFGIIPHTDLNIMQPDKDLAGLTAGLNVRLDEVMATGAPDLIRDQDDTTTIITTAMAEFYRKIPFDHVEAGLRTGDKYFPFHEEINRHIAATMTDFPIETNENYMSRSGRKRSASNIKWISKEY